MVLARLFVCCIHICLHSPAQNHTIKSIEWHCKWWYWLYPLIRSLLPSLHTLGIPLATTVLIKSTQFVNHIEQNRVKYTARRRTILYVVMGVLIGLDIEKCACVCVSMASLANQSLCSCTQWPRFHQAVYMRKKTVHAICSMLLFININNKRNTYIYNVNWIWNKMKIYTIEIQSSSSVRWQFIVIVFVVTNAVHLFFRLRCTVSAARSFFLYTFFKLFRRNSLKRIENITNDFQNKKKNNKNYNNNK